MVRVSAGLLMYRKHKDELQVLLVHPGGPYFQNKDEHVWSIPKGEVKPGEVLLAAALREFFEELAVTPRGPFIPLAPIKQKGGKVVYAWGFSGECEPTGIVSNTFTMVWPPRSGQMATFPEIDRAEFFNMATAKRKIIVEQAAFLDELAAAVRTNCRSVATEQ